MTPDPSPPSPRHNNILPPSSPESPLAVFDAAPSPILAGSGSRSQLEPRSELSDAVVSAAPNPSASSPRQAGASSSASNNIEMEPIPGHRRRKSSLMNPVGGHSHPGVPSPGRPSYSQSSRNNGPTPAALPEGSNEHLHVPGRGAGESGSAARDDPGGESLSDDDLCDDEEMGLTRKDKTRRQKKRRRNTLLDNRIAREKHLSDDECKEADRNVVKSLFINGALILLWYFFSLSISLFALSGLVLTFVPSLRPKAAHSSDGGRSRHESEPQGSVMSKMFYFTRIGPCGAATSLDIGLGNTSLKFISLTFYTMCKSSSLAFVLLFAFVFRLETPTWRLVAIIATMTFGVILMVFGEVEFKFGGFFLVISAAFFSGLRWALTQILLLRNPATSNPFSSIFFLSPVMFIVLLSLAIPVEGFGPLWDGLKALGGEWGVWTPLFLLFPGSIAFLMIASEFALLQRTSVVTLSIAGIFKEVVTISAASVVFDDKLTPINFVGLLVTMAAIGAYNYVKISKMRQDAQIEVHERHADGAHPVTPISNSGSGSDADNDDSAAETAGLLRQTDGQEQGIVTVDNNAQPGLPRPPNA
ncbi:nucleotide-sugar transporter [Metarhizium album ARSEF 1941]|uniref:Nucleotide-sugar transporter n=1 Tax=Metarhizium album (strain ARSEF 1941) TaxID=1081103 RepID=A0A0B2WPA8_METAS|nr:nucleotide-sugar transporter [Metarhizium album ARSEF 1941]KHN95302.1 nucleotide-sugar transporter [Metarhizium album ARSEF 1941]